MVLTISHSEDIKENLEWMEANAECKRELVKKKYSTIVSRKCKDLFHILTTTLLDGVNRDWRS
jgi:hypothetical protein